MQLASQTTILETENCGIESNTTITDTDFNQNKDILDTSLNGNYNDNNTNNNDKDNNNSNDNNNSSTKGNHDVTVTFSLPAGSYATAFLREVMKNNSFI
jgi:tRNA(Glu) U13 pseudouridine synthase TruD